MVPAACSPPSELTPYRSPVLRTRPALESWISRAVPCAEDRHHLPLVKIIRSKTEDHTATGASASARPPYRVVP
jgi:hypothetical protein